MLKKINRKKRYLIKSTEQKNGEEYKYRWTRREMKSHGERTKGHQGTSWRKKEKTSEIDEERQYADFRNKADIEESNERNRQ